MGENKKSKAVKTLRIIKDVVLGIVLVFLVSVLIVTLMARVNGKTPVLFGHAVYRISSGSMEPYLKVGDIIMTTECDPLTLKEGDIITYDGTKGEFAGKRVTHRVVKAPYLNDEDGEYYLVTKGDNNPIEDSPIITSQVISKYEYKVELLKTLYDFFITPGGFLVIIGLIILAFGNEIYIFVHTLTHKEEADEHEHESIDEIIERVQRKAKEEEKKNLSTPEEKTDGE